jgi:hypothetical protein
MTDLLKLESIADIPCRRSEQVTRSFTECPESCTWFGRCLNGTKFDNGKNGLKSGSFAPWIDFFIIPLVSLLEVLRTQLTI